MGAAVKEYSSQPTHLKLVEYRPKRKPKSKRILKQKLVGVALLIISFIMILMLSNVPQNASPEDSNGIAILFTVPLGMWLLFTKKYIFVN